MSTGVMMLIASACLNLYTSWLLVQMSRATGAESFEVRFQIGFSMLLPNCTVHTGAYALDFWEEN